MGILILLLVYPIIFIVGLVFLIKAIRKRNILQIVIFSFCCAFGGVRTVQYMLVIYHHGIG
jgi:hypothetical protein